MNLDCAYYSEPGSVHEYEDRILFDTKRNLFAVADGVTISTQGFGGIAAEKAVRLLEEYFDGNLVNSVKRVNDELYMLKMKDESIGETTLTSCYIHESYCEVVNIGDSPAILVRDGRIEEIYEKDRISIGYLSSVLGYRKGIKPHEKKVEIKNSDLIILCSDGVEHILNTEFIGNIVKEESKTSEIALRIVETAKIYPSDYDDDKTVIVIRIE